jgi:argininosuccinate synthase
MDVVQGLYDEKESSMDELGGFEPTDTTGFIQIESIRIKKYVKKAYRELI